MMTFFGLCALNVSIPAFGRVRGVKRPVQIGMVMLAPCGVPWCTENV